ncbi:MAG: UDP-glucose 4-epimerase GalE [Burkholderiales bacterium]|nr:MAG: UDP-glucose 4-epimerase GalE [Burkholderiales bacterium]
MSEASASGDGRAWRVLVTGGAGYIGSHTVVELLRAGHEVVVLDNLANASAESLRRVERITGRAAPLVRADIRDEDALSALLRSQRFDAAIHFAGLKAVGESVARPLDYYDNNVAGTATLLRALAAADVRRLVFSSSATVYGDPERVPITEDARTGPTNPYGRTKWMIELMLGDLAAADPRWSISILRYFNPAGAHESGLIGEDPRGVPNNLMPYVSQVAIGRLPQLSVFGGDWPTPDGTGVRDYIHVVDLARGHLAALDRVLGHRGAFTVNLGTGTGYSVLELVRAFERASGRAVPYRIVDRRPGDIAACYADPSAAATLLGWRAELGLERMCADAWRWQQANPQGYGDA